MKTYDREKKKWVTEEEYARTRKSRDKKICRGGKPHDFALILPDYVIHVDGKYKFNPERYYEIMDEEFTFLQEQARKLEEMGVTSRYSRWNQKTTRTYVCTNCGKRDHRRPGDNPLEPHL